MNVKYREKGWLMSNSNTYWCKENFSWKVPPTNWGTLTLDFPRMKAKGLWSHYVIFKLITLPLKKDNLDLSPNDSLMGIIVYNLPP